MEDILASIRRILSEDEAAPNAAPGAAAPAASKSADDGVLQLTEQMLAPDASEAPTVVPAAVAAPAPPPAPPPPVVMATPPPPPAAPPPAPAAAGPISSSTQADIDSLLEAPAAMAAATALSALARTAPPPGALPGATPIGNGAITLEELVRQELRPLLRDWLNANLPGVVEAAVAREMERVRARIG